MAVSKKRRFEVFKRDGFTCGYCGRRPPAVTLEVDHIEPKSKGGDDDKSNLITSCFDCNRGKSNVPLDQIPTPLADNMNELKERENQIKEYRKFKSGKRRRENRDFRVVEKVFQETYEDMELTKKFKRVSLRRFVNALPLDEIENAMYLATGRVPHSAHQCIKYFCGVCWNKIREAGE